MNRSKVTTLLLLLVLVLGVIAFPIFAPEKPQSEDVSEASVTTLSVDSTTVATEPTAVSSTANTTRKTTVHKTAARKNTTARQTTEAVTLVDENGYYYDLEHVVLYLDIYGRLPQNYIPKKQAQALGWSGGSVERVKEGAAIGGDRFGNYEKILPTGVSYTECDLDTDGGKSRGTKRLIFSSDGRYYYTKNHYKTFTEYVIRGGRVEPK